jgi:glycosyltransferase involved in cell wall biosynthesis
MDDRSLGPLFVEMTDQMRRRLRVLFVIGTLGGGGAERQIVEILKHLDRDVFEPILYVASREGELLSEVPADVSIHSFWDEFLASWQSVFHRILRTVPFVRWRNLAKILANERIDVVYDRTFLATLDAAVACWLRPTPRVSCCVGDPAPEFQIYSRRVPLMARRISRWAYSSASIVLTNSAGLRHRLIEFFSLPAAHIRTQYNLLDFERMERLAVEFVPAVSESPFLIVTSGRLDPLKGQQFLLEAVRELIQKRGRQVQLVLLGNGPLERPFRDYVSEHNLEQNITFAGFVSNPFPWYRRAKLFVLPSLHEGLPNALIEAVSCGTPVLASDCPSGPSEILDGGRTGHLIRPGDSQALADAIAQCMDNYAQWQMLTAAASLRAKNMFELRVGLKVLENLLIATASGRNPAGLA